jgi:[amino group carrier protein]-lysine/ornithine hydrolase
MSLLTEIRAMGLLRRMLEIPSPSTGEADLARYLVSAMGELGLRAWRDNAGNALGETGCGGRPLVMLLSHMDTVPRMLPVRAEAGRLHGRGAVDAKGPLATMICAAAGIPGFAG